MSSLNGSVFLWVRSMPGIGWQADLLADLRLLVSPPHMSLAFDIDGTCLEVPRSGPVDTPANAVTVEIYLREKAGYARLAEAIAAVAADDRVELALASGRGYEFQTRFVRGLNARRDPRWRAIEFATYCCEHGLDLQGSVSEALEEARLWRQIFTTNRRTFMAALTDIPGVQGYLPHERLITLVTQPWTEPEEIVETVKMRLRGFDHRFDDCLYAPAFGRVLDVRPPPAQVSKALLWEAFGRGRSSTRIAIGDDDLPLMKDADIAVLPGNADPEVLNEVRRHAALPYSRLRAVLSISDPGPQGVLRFLELLQEARRP